MASVCAARMPHPCLGRAAAVGTRLPIRQGKSLLILQLTSVSRGRSTIHCLVEAGGGCYSSAPPPLLTNRDISLIGRGRLYSSCMQSSMLHGSD